jgi:16S rRNA (uracil1498-N3)-methyltransferase
LTAPRFFHLSDDLRAGADVQLDDAAAHHAAAVLRMSAGEPLVLVGTDGAWDGVVSSVSRGVVRARVVGRSAESGGELPIEITVLQAVTKGAKFDDVVEKTVELGARRVVPVRCARSYGSATPQKVERWRRIARAAAEQSRRRVLPVVEEPIDWRDAIESYAARMPVIVGWERSAKGTIQEAIARCRDARAAAIAVGPEGSLDDDELEVARQRGCLLVFLGPTILKTDTAASAMLAGLATGCGWW